jgi:predicted ATPase/DNA-binding winged helix-turn-helix (wHTH) protein
VTEHPRTTEVVVLSFGNFRLLRDQRILEKDGTPTDLGERAIELLTVFAENANKLLSGEELLERVWPGKHVKEGSLRFQVAALRKVLDDDSHASYIRNIAGRGYLFAASVEQSSASTPTRTADAGAALRPEIPGRLLNMVGRDAAVSSIVELVLARRLVTIAGPGGIGKTTVAVAVAHDLSTSFGPHLRFVPLGNLNDARLLPAHLASAFRLQGNSDDPVNGLISHLRHRRFLLVLDGCEHLVDSAADIAERILREAPKVCLLTTSREPLRIGGEHTYRLPALDLPPPDPRLSAKQATSFPVVELFVERASARSGGFKIDDAIAPIVASICRRLDGIPLAVELAASRVGVLGLSAIVKGLENRLSLLTDGWRTALPRHQTLRATLEWSHQLLSPGEQAVFRRLSVFRGSFKFDAGLASVVGESLTSDDVAEFVANLGLKSLLTLHHVGQTVQYRFLDTTREFAWEKLLESGEGRDISRRHAELFNIRLEKAEPDWPVLTTDDWMAAYAGNIDEIRAALDWAFAPAGNCALGIALVTESAPVWFALSLIGEFCELAERALGRLEAAGLAGSKLEMRLRLSFASAVFNFRGPGPTLSAESARALEIADQLEEPDYQLRALWQLARERSSQGDYPNALVFCRRFDAVLKNSNDAAMPLVRDRMMALGLYFLGRPLEALAYAERAIDHPAAAIRSVHKAFNEWDNSVASRSHLARVQWVLGHPAEASKNAADGLRHALKLGYPPTTCHILVYACCPTAIWSGDLARAREYLSILRDQSDNAPLGFWQLWLRYYEAVLSLRKTDDVRHIRDQAQLVVSETKPLLIVDMIGTLNEELAGPEAVSRAVGGQAEWCAPEIFRAKGAVLSRSFGQDVIAEAWLLRSLTLSRNQCAFAWELRAATSLASLFFAQARMDEARQLLTATLAKLRDPMETSDLLAARSLIAKL